MLAFWEPISSDSPALAGVVEDQLLVDVESGRAVGEQVDVTAGLGDRLETRGPTLRSRVITIRQFTPRLASAASAS